MIEETQGRIDYDEAGAGPTIVLCPDHAAPAPRGGR
jgi:hypothetical protein